MNVTIREKMQASWHKLGAEDDSASYLLSPLTELELNDVRPYIRVSEDSIHVSTEGLIAILGLCLKGWKDLTNNKTGMSIPMPAKSKDQVKVIPIADLYAIAWHVMTTQKPDDEDIKKS